MKSAFFSGLAVLLTASFVVAGESRIARTAVPAVTPILLGQASDIPLPSAISPVPDPAFSGTTAFPVSSQPLELFQDVRYRSTRNIAPCAVPTVVQVPDPCNRDRCCKTCVNVQICVPPCEPCDIKVTRDGNRVRYDYGKYNVVIRTVGNHVVVHYGD
ncbi:hypothetical protein [Schlesneria paludicola]|uniref:hypothetical protein n=1 Tax=Schlesneria paludicola TaxID=360056 RepID=UPI00029A17E8|nr:hypothetical protein [Schlesneria paludicola]